MGWMGSTMLQSIELQEAYGDGLSQLLNHLAARQPPTLHAWLQLKQEVERGTEEPATWRNLSSLEEDFVLINHHHLRRSVGSNAYSVLEHQQMPSAVHV